MLLPIISHDWQQHSKHLHAKRENCEEIAPDECFSHLNAQAFVLRTVPAPHITN
jgi:hypothetical protein